MHKCNNCGTEFDSKFCPECGQKWVDDSTCPQCGNTLPINVKFCPDCGYRVAQSAEDENSDTVERKSKNSDNRPPFAARLYGVLRYVPMALAVLFAVLLPLLYIAPIAEAGEMLAGAENINVYSLDEDFFGVSVAYLVFMCIAFLLSAVLLYLHINKDKRQQYITLFGKIDISIGELASLLAVVLIYLPCIIISAVAMSDAAELNELLGGGVVDMVFAGAAPKAILSFAVIFTVFAICASVARILIARANPELLPEDDDDEQVEVTPCRKPLLYYAFLNAKLRRAAFAFFICTVFTIIMLFFFSGVLSDATTFKPYIIVAIGDCITVVVVIGCMFGANDKDWSPYSFIYEVQRKRRHSKDGLAIRKDKCKLGIKKVIFLFAFFVSFIFMFIQYAVQGRSVYTRNWIMVAVHIGMSAIIYVIAKTAIAKQSGYIAQYLFDTVRPLPDAPLTVDFNQERELAAYDAYVLAKKRRTVLSESNSTRQRVFSRRLALVSACVMFVLTVIVCAVVSPILTNKFSASFVSDFAEAVRSEKHVNIGNLFGNPNEFEEYGESVLLVYYDDEYADLKEQLERAQKELNISKEQELNRKIANLTFYSLTIQILKENKDYKDHLNWATVEAIALNTKTTVDKVTSQKKTTKIAKLFGAKYNTKGYTADRFYVEIFYTDGSYKYDIVSTSEFSEIDFSKTGKQTVKWSDEWGSYSATVKSE